MRDWRTDKWSSKFIIVNYEDSNDIGYHDLICSCWKQWFCWHVKPFPIIFHPIPRCPAIFLGESRKVTQIDPSLLEQNIRFEVSFFIVDRISIYFQISLKTWQLVTLSFQVSLRILFWQVWSLFNDVLDEVYVPASNKTQEIHIEASEIET